VLRSTWEGVESLEVSTGRVRRETATGGSVGPLQGSAFLLGDRTGRVQRWALADPRPQQESPAHASAISALAVSAAGDLVVTGGADAKIRIWQADAWRRLVEVQLLPGSDWLAFSPTGFFDGTPAAWANASFHYRSEALRIYAPEQFFATFYQPGLLRDVTAAAAPIEQVLASRGDTRATQRLDAVRRSRAPGVRIVSPRDTVEFETGFASEGTWSLPDGRSLPSVTPRDLGSVELTHALVSSATVTLKLEIHDNGSGVRDCRVFQNRALIDDRLGEVGVDAMTRVGVLETEVEVVAGRNELTAYCFNDEDVRSEIARVTIEGSNALKRQGKAYVLSMGGNAYRGNLRPLRYAEADARAMLDSVRSNLEAAGRYRVVPVPLYGADATRGNLLAALGRLGRRNGGQPAANPGVLAGLSKARIEDAVLVFFAGHGRAYGDRYALFPIDAAGGPRALGGITDLELEATLRDINAGHLILILDTCQSGQLLVADESRRGPLNTRGFAQLAYEKQVEVLAAAQSYQLAFEDSALRHGVLTYALVRDGLDGFLADSAPTDHTLGSREWLRYALRRVPELQGVVARARLARGEALFPEQGPLGLRLQQPQAYLPPASVDSLVIAVRNPAQ
jgi:hypothetical protein